MVPNTFSKVARSMENATPFVSPTTLAARGSLVASARSPKYSPGPKVWSWYTVHPTEMSLTNTFPSARM